MITTGMGMVSVIRVVNNTGVLIDKIIFVYDSDSKKINLKKIKNGSTNQTGISTISPVNNLKMIIDGIDKSYLIREHINRGCADRIVITINSIDDNNCEFVVENKEF